MEGETKSSGDYFAPSKDELLSELLALQSASKQRPDGWLSRVII